MKAIIADLYKPKKGEIEVGYYGAVLNLGNEIVELRTNIDNIFELSDLFEIFETVNNSIEETNMKKIENIVNAIHEKIGVTAVIWEIESKNSDLQEIITRFEMLNEISPFMDIEIINKGKNPILLARANGIILSDIKGKIEEIKIN